MKKLIKMFKDILNGLVKSQVKVLQSEAFENQLANTTFAPKAHLRYLMFQVLAIHSKRW